MVCQRLLLFAAVIGVQACEPDDGVPVPPVVPPEVACALADPDTIFFVPQDFQPVTFPSKGAEYYYESGEQGECGYWIVDIKMDPVSNKPPPLLSPGEVIIKPGPYDLPSSANAGGTIPAIEEDCNRLSVRTFSYRRLAGESDFTTIGWSQSDGSWQASERRCLLLVSKDGQGVEIRAPASESGWDTYRAAVRVLLRNSGQEAEVRVIHPPPK